MSKDKKINIELLTKTNSIENHVQKAGFSNCAILFLKFLKNNMNKERIIKELERLFDEMKTVDTKPTLYYDGFRDCIEFLKENL